MLELKNINKSFGKKVVFDNLSTVFNEKGVSLIVGINGAGKTTFLNAIVGLIGLDSGEINLNGYERTNVKFKEQVFYVPSDFFLPEYMTGYEYANFILQRYEKGDLKRFIHLANILELNDALSDTLETYSYGMKKKIQLALMASCKPTLILGDEIFTGLDFETSMLVKKIIKNLSSTSKILLVSHEYDILKQFSEDIRVLNKGKILSMTGDVHKIISKIEFDSRINEKYEKLEKCLSTD